MAKIIILPLDGSPLGARAVPYAAALARRTRGRLVLLQAVQSHGQPGSDPNDVDAEATRGAEEYLQEAARQLVPAGVAVDTHVYRDDPVHAIVDATQHHRADLIVMSTHGRTGFGRMLYGSVADQVLRQATVPVLLVPASVDHAWPDDRPLSVLVPLDGSALAEEALKSAEQLTQAYAAELLLLRAVELPVYPLYGDGYAYVPFDEDAALADARQYVEGHAARLRAQGLKVATDVTVGAAGRVIERIVRERAVDVVTMATHGRGGLARLVLGSVATDALRRAAIPLLLVRPAGLHQEPRLSAAPIDGEAEPLASASAPAPVSMVDVRLSASDLKLIECGLKALAYAPGSSYEDTLAARALGHRLEEIAASRAR